MVESWNHMEAEQPTCIYSQNRLVDAVISGVLGAAVSKEKLLFTYQGWLPQELGIDDLDLCFSCLICWKMQRKPLRKSPWILENGRFILRLEHTRS